MALNSVAGVLLRESKEGLRHIEERPCEDEDRGWMDAPTHQAMPRTADRHQKSQERPAMDSPSEPPLRKSWLTMPTP